MIRLTSLVLFACALGVSPARAQSAPPPHLSVLDGTATLERGQERETATPNTPLALGDRLRTDLGRAEVLLGDGSALHLDERTAIDLNGDSVVRLLDGRLIVLAESGAAGVLQIDSAPASVRLQSSGEVRLDLRGDGSGRAELEVGVVRGLVDVMTDQGTVP